MRLLQPAVILVLFGLFATASGQQTNGPNASLALNGDPALTVGQGPIVTTTAEGVGVVLRLLSDANAPIVLFAGPPAIGTVDLGSIGSYDLFTPPATSILIDGYAGMITTNASGRFTMAAVMPPGTAGLQVGLQAIVQDATNPPFFLKLTAAGEVSVGIPAVVTPASDSAVLFPFPSGMSFPFYGSSYTEFFVHENGFISFGSPQAGFPNPSVADIRGGRPRIMAYYNDLVLAQSTPYGGEISVASYTDPAGLATVHVDFFRLAEFGDTTGPHGGEITMNELGDISIFLPPYNAITPAINTGVGITPGLGIGPLTYPTPFGRNLDFDALTGPTLLPVDSGGFELFLPGFSTSPNPLDLVNFQASQGGIHFIKSPGIPQYTIQ